jgi:hypothetical protein
VQAILNEGVSTKEIVSSIEKLYENNPNLCGIASSFGYSALRFSKPDEAKSWLEIDRLNKRLSFDYFRISAILEMHNSKISVAEESIKAGYQNFGGAQGAFYTLSLISSLMGMGKETQELLLKSESRVPISPNPLAGIPYINDHNFINAEAIIEGAYRANFNITDALIMVDLARKSEVNSPFSQTRDRSRRRYRGHWLSLFNGK